MKLTTFKLNNYRNVKLNCELSFSNYSVFIGGNNQGKTNCLKAIDVATFIIKNKNFIIPSSYLSYQDDYPKSKQSDSPLKPVCFEMTFALSETERRKMFETTGVRNNGKIALCIEITFQTTSSKRVSKRPAKINFFFKGKRGRASVSYNENKDKILSFIASNFDYVYIPAIRNEDDSISIIRELVSIKIKELNSDNDYLEQLDSIYEKEAKAINTIKDNLLRDLKEYIPEINDVSINVENDRRLMRSSLEFMVDDGVNTSIKNKGAGIISLMALALLQGQSKNSTMIAIEEPESHLHADSIHKIAQKLIQASFSKQIIVSTHNPSFISTSNLKDVYIVKNGSVSNAQNVSEIRTELGLAAKDSLFMSDKVVIVEGESDRRFIKRIIEEYSPSLSALIKEGNLDIYSARSSSKIVPLIFECKQWMVNYFAIFDSDQSGKRDYEELNESLHSFLIQSPSKKESEIEDIIEPSIVVQALIDFGVLTDAKRLSRFKQKFHSFAEHEASVSGIEVTKELLDSIKTKIMDYFIKSDFNTVNHKYSDIYKNIVTRIECCFISSSYVSTK